MKKMKYRASCPTAWGKHIKGRDAETRIAAIVSLNRVARLTGNRINFNELVVKAS